MRNFQGGNSVPAPNFTGALTFDGSQYSLYRPCCMDWYTQLCCNCRFRDFLLKIVTVSRSHTPIVTCPAVMQWKG
jgi:hypothetical protein